MRKRKWLIVGGSVASAVLVCIGGWVYVHHTSGQHHLRRLASEREAEELSYGNSLELLLNSGINVETAQLSGPLFGTPTYTFDFDPDMQGFTLKTEVSTDRKITFHIRGGKGDGASWLRLLGEMARIHTENYPRGMGLRVPDVEIEIHPQATEFLTFESALSTGVKFKDLPSSYQAEILMLLVSMDAFVPIPKGREQLFRWFGEAEQKGLITPLMLNQHLYTELTRYKFLEMLRDIGYLQEARGRYERQADGAYVEMKEPPSLLLRDYPYKNHAPDISSEHFWDLVPREVEGLFGVSQVHPKFQTFMAWMFEYRIKSELLKDKPKPFGYGKWVRGLHQTIFHSTTDAEMQGLLKFVNESFENKYPISTQATDEQITQHKKNAASWIRTVFKNIGGPDPTPRKAQLKAIEGLFTEGRVLRLTWEQEQQEKAQIHYDRLKGYQDASFFDLFEYRDGDVRLRQFAFEVSPGRAAPRYMAEPWAFHKVGFFLNFYIGGVVSHLLAQGVAKVLGEASEQCELSPTLCLNLDPEGGPGVLELVANTHFLIGPAWFALASMGAQVPMSVARKVGQLFPRLNSKITQTWQAWANRMIDGTGNRFVAKQKLNVLKGGPRFLYGQAHMALTMFLLNLMQLPSERIVFSHDPSQPFTTHPIPWWDRVEEATVGAAKTTAAFAAASIMVRITRVSHAVEWSTGRSAQMMSKTLSGLSKIKTYLRSLRGAQTVVRGAEAARISGRATIAGAIITEAVSHGIVLGIEMAIAHWLESKINTEGGETLLEILSRAEQDQFIYAEQKRFSGLARQLVPQFLSHTEYLRRAYRAYQVSGEDGRKLEWVEGPLQRESVGAFNPIIESLDLSFQPIFSCQPEQAFSWLFERRLQDVQVGDQFIRRPCSITVPHSDHIASGEAIPTGLQLMYFGDGFNMRVSQVLDLLKGLDKKIEEQENQAALLAQALEKFDDETMSAEDLHRIRGLAAMPSEARYASDVGQELTTPFENTLFELMSLSPHLSNDQWLFSLADAHYFTEAYFRGVFEQRIESQACQDMMIQMAVIDQREQREAAGFGNACLRWIADQATDVHTQFIETIQDLRDAYLVYTQDLGYATDREAFQTLKQAGYIYAINDTDNPSIDTIGVESRHEEIFRLRVDRPVNTFDAESLQSSFAAYTSLSPDEQRLSKLMIAYLYKKKLDKLISDLYDWKETGIRGHVSSIADARLPADFESRFKERIEYYRSQENRVVEQSQYVIQNTDLQQNASVRILNDYIQNRRRTTSGAQSSLLHTLEQDRNLCHAYNFSQQPFLESGVMQLTQMPISQAFDHTDLSWNNCFRDLKISATFKLLLYLNYTLYRLYRDGGLPIHLADSGGSTPTAIDFNPENSFEDVYKRISPQLWFIFLNSRPDTADEQKRYDMWEIVPYRGYVEEGEGEFGDRYRDPSPQDHVFLDEVFIHENFSSEEKALAKSCQLPVLQIVNGGYASTYFEYFILTGLVLPYPTHFVFPWGNFKNSLSEKCQTFITHYTATHPWVEDPTLSLSRFGFDKPNPLHHTFSWLPFDHTLYVAASLFTTRLLLKSLKDHVTRYTRVALVSECSNVARDIISSIMGVVRPATIFQPDPQESPLNYSCVRRFLEKHEATQLLNLGSETFVNRLRGQDPNNLLTIRNQDFSSQVQEINQVVCAQSSLEGLASICDVSESGQPIWQPRAGVGSATVAEFVSEATSMGALINQCMMWNWSGGVSGYLTLHPHCEQTVDQSIPYYIQTLSHFFDELFHATNL